MCEKATVLTLIPDRNVETGVVVAYQTYTCVRTRHTKENTNRERKVQVGQEGSCKEVAFKAQHKGRKLDVITSFLSVRQHGNSPQVGKILYRDWLSGKNRVSKDFSC